MIRAVLAGVLVMAAGCAERDQVGDWIRDLKSENEYTRYEAAKQLARLRADQAPLHELPVGAGPLPLRGGEQRVVDGLNDALMIDERADQLSYVATASALGQFRPPGVQPGLVRCVLARQWTASDCMHTIVRIATPEILADMLPLLAIDDPAGAEFTVRITVADWLEETGDAITPGVRSVIEADDDAELSRAVMFYLLYRAPEDDRPRLQGTEEILHLALRSRHADVRYDALDSLDSMGFDPQRPEIAALIEDPDEDVRTKAKAMLEGRQWHREGNRR